MEISANVTKTQHVDAYLKIWNGGLQMTPKELDITKAIIALYERYSDDNVKEPSLSEMVFSAKNLRVLKEDLEISKQNWSNYKTSLLKKRVLFSKNGDLRINPYLIPADTLTFKFNIDGK